MEGKGNLFRNLTKDEIEVRVNTISKSGSGFSALLYKTARTDARLLDETFGAMNWQCAYRSIDGKLYCQILVWDENKEQWISKENVGVDSKESPEKGEASDALKRAGYTLGLGVELYTQPFIWFSLGGVVLPSKPTFDFEITDYECSDKKEITYLKICAKFKDVNGAMQTKWFEHGEKPSKKTAKSEKPKEEISQASVVDNGETSVACSDCGKPILGHEKHSAASIIEGTVRAHGRPLCWDCAKKAKGATSNQSSKGGNE